VTDHYLDALFDLARRGDAREESHYPALNDLLNTLARAQGRDIQVTVLPKPTEAGNPDFRVWDGSYQVIGYIEAKAPGANLDQVETSAQLQRYLHTFPNLILTDFYEFRLYRNGAFLESARLARPFIAQTLKTKPPAEQVKALACLFETFFSFALPPSFTAEDLARELARRTRFMRDEVIRPELKQQVSVQQGPLYGFYDAFRKYLIASLTEDQFADLYAQTITYGLFAARTRAQGQFNRLAAYALIPATIGILRDVFQFISLGQPSPQMEAIVDDIAAVLNAADVQAILTQYYQRGKGDDPILHFYETFLAEYDPETRERRGVYYTPQPVVRYIVRAVHDLLKTRFSMPDGLADERVTLLDPAAGTLTFPAEAIRLAFQEFTDKYGAGAKENFLRNHILPHFYAFELLMAPYAIGHMKIGFLLESLGVPLKDKERFQFYLTNALEMEDLQQIPIPGLASLSQESHQAAQVKKNEPILVILGNPPYSGISANQNDWTEKLLKTDLDGAQSYYTVDGQPLGEKNPKWLQDDYVKFLRFAQWKIHKAGRGIVAMITNHGYLDNPTFRGMRQSLLKTFDEIYILDLHGNNLKRETAPGGGADENVFDIRQGVAIALFVKYGETASSSQAGSAGEDFFHWQTAAPVWEKLKPYAREMRKNPTPAEDALWQHLRLNQLGVKFRRQHAIGPFIVDFYAREARLIIEVDGPIHKKQKEYDEMRQAYLESLGYRVVRFTNEQVLQNMDAVLAILQKVLSRPHPPAPSPYTGKGNPPSPQAMQANPPSPQAGRGPGGRVYHAHLYGSRADKYAWLDAHDLSTAGYQPITPESPSYFFTPRQTQNLQAYQSWPSVTEIFPVNGVGMTTARDEFVIDLDSYNLLNRIRTFKHSDLDDKGLHQAFGIRVKKGWSIRKAWKELQSIDDGQIQEYIQPVLYRPFDVRYIFYHDAVVWRTVKRVMRHMLAGENLGLITARSNKSSVMDHFFITDKIMETKCGESTTQSALFPLYLYPSTDSPDMFHQERKPNLADWLLPKLSAAYGFIPTPEEVLAYIYAVLYSPTYRQQYAQELRTDFPRLPFTADGALFRQMAALGQQLIDLHLLRSTPLLVGGKGGVKYQGQGSDVVEKVRYDAATGRVHINADKYFEGVTPEMWEYQIGGYQVLEKYLKDRKGRRLDDPVRYIHIASAIAETIRLQQQIGALYPQVEAQTI
jgi:very-short-patch-repair endonuclease